MIAVGIQGEDSNNIKKELYIDCPYVPNNAAFASAINALERFAVSAKEIPTFKAISNDTVPTTYYIELLGMGKGIYGIGGIVLSAIDIKVTATASSAKEIATLSTTQIIDLEHTGTNVIDSLNSQLPGIAIQDQINGYAIIKGFFENGIYREYLWIGQAGTYGGNGSLQAVLLDVKEFSGSTTTDTVNSGSNESTGGTSDQNNFSRKIVVTPANLSGTGTIEQQICDYVNTLGYLKQDTDTDIWIEIDGDAVVIVDPVDCIVSAWSDWSACSLSGFQSRNRTVITPASNGGAYCPVLYETRACVYTAPTLATSSFYYEGRWELADTKHNPNVNCWVDYYDENAVLIRKRIGAIENGCQQIIASSIKKVNNCILCTP
ncbi:hypothetical protein SAMN05443667_101246 [Flavobacterium gillisiae]|uniref:Spondin-like TSP1 domain-containing protein n=1 Tax=Flavobacterium gillisiae TaxID=150146 RepID=A0A1H3WWH4_9FLAO|nr:thrombospondin type-1 domain-containing protein [Flavobacterium gillisiae]SDZ90734.1 hypothetical protein SAMN05443667_101246 [Flavobacterium gillisiae]